nr:SRPBCC domain-containing protein [Amycolatopsis suaedae]
MTFPHTGLRVTASGSTDLVLTRAFAAPASLVFAALTEPGLLRRWHGARGWHLTTCEVDLRPGGAWKFVSTGPDGTEMVIHGWFHEVEHRPASCRPRSTATGPRARPWSLPSWRRPAGTPS